MLPVCYRQGVRFDEKYYFEKHIPLAGPLMAALGVKIKGDVKNYYDGQTDVMIGEVLES